MSHKTVLFRIDPTKHRKLKILAAQEGISMQSIFNRQLEEMLRQVAADDRSASVEKRDQEDVDASE